MRIDRQRGVRCGILVVAAIAISACSDDDSAGGGGGGDNTEDEAPVTAEAAAGESFTPSGSIEVWLHEAPGNAVLHELFDEYEEEFPDVTIDVLEIPFADFETNSLRSTSAGDGPDLIKLSGWVLPDWADKGLLVPMEPELVGFEDEGEMVAAFEDGVLEGVSFDDEAYALPVDYQNLMLFYNKAHFEETGLDPDDPPETWEEVAEVGEQLTQRNGEQVDRAGFSWWFTTEIWVYLELEAMAAQLDGSVLDPDASEGALNTDAGMRSVDYYLDLATNRQIAPMELIDTGVLDLFAEGSASMMVSGSFQEASIAGRTDGEFSLAAGTMGVGPMPVFEDATSDVTSAYSWGWGITNNADEPRLAGHLARWLTEPDQADRIFAEAGLATPYAGFGDSEAANANEANQMLVEQIDRSVYGPRIPQFTEMMTELTQQIQNGATGQKPAEQVAEDFDTAMQRVLR